jgi:hypothetical protein
MVAVARLAGIPFLSSSLSSSIFFLLLLDLQPLSPLYLLVLEVNPEIVLLVNKQCSASLA